ncbi:hypothetical protein BST81_03215 [Leptolyngbya sp. 'hensonii']|uniref:DOMON-like domain-containing protein n=1 Tax=Leptolyngbya sp. 'hensonii' TaxID=1922337 RepID=UPI00094FD112|nr:DOMON-like domain-containing protein [Leptolyngbya sp. 'hensonii']OLP19857.1 hypothetical protein BST81_03215 [Leptolyngbya sp. 'hensonii']
MSGQPFSLQPFPNSTLSGLTLSGSLARSADRLYLQYDLQGALAEMEITPPAAQPERRHQLWETTCFEFFLGLPRSPRYWEFNLSPAGHWNVYYFDSYRQGMQEETGVTWLSFQVQSAPNSLALALNFDLTAIVPPGKKLEVAVTSVIQLRTGQISYWALTHSGPEADFHRRDSFTLMV